MSAFPLPAAKPAPSVPVLAAGAPVLFDVSPYAGRSIAEISEEDLAALADRAWDRAARQALAQGHSITVETDAGLAEMAPDGRLSYPYGSHEAPAPRF